MDAAPPIVDAFVERCRLDSRGVGPLRNRSFAVKDLFDVAGRHTGCGNPSWRATHPIAAHHAGAVQRLLDAGGLLVGKTRTDELAYSLDGRNVHEGAPRNPAAPMLLTGGSSSGSASAVAGGEADFAIATDTAGSVRVPAAWCGVLGLRPTHGRVGVSGLVPLAPSFDTVGWMSRSGELMSTVGRVLLDQEAAPVPGVRIVADRRLDALADGRRRSTGDAPAGRFAGLRGEPEAVDLGLDLIEAAEALRILQGGEAWNTHGAWIEATRPRFGPGIAERFTAARAITDDQTARAGRVRAAVIDRMESVLSPGMILCLPGVPGPAAPRAASSLLLQQLRARLFPLTALASLTGRPQITLPLETVDGAPVGISLLGWRHGDEALLDIAAAVCP